MTNYSPWMLLATKLQTNIELIMHSPSTIFQYVTKGSGGVDPLVRSADEVGERQSGAGRGRSRIDRLNSETASVEKSLSASSSSRTSPPASPWSSGRICRPACYLLGRTAAPTTPSW